MSTYRDAWESAKACQVRTGNTVTLSVSLSHHTNGRQWTTIYCHWNSECRQVANFTEAVDWFNSRGAPALNACDVLTEVPAILETSQ